MAKLKDIEFPTAFSLYRPSSVLGEGGAGIVYQVADEDGVENAVKCLRPSNISSSRLKRFKNEMHFLQSTRHKNIVPVLDYGVASIDEDVPFFVMRLFPTTLRKMMRQGIDTKECLFYFSQILDGVEAAHLLRIWHRDLKPENVLCDVEQKELAVADFGIAHFSQEMLLTAIETSSSDRLANFQYAAPEQRVRDKEVDSRADIYALGLILNEMFTGEIIQGTGYKTVASVAEDHVYLDQIIERMVRQDPGERPGSIGELKSVLNIKRSEYFAAQKIDKMKAKIIPEGEIDDPLALEAPAIVDLDYQSGNLILSLTPKPTPLWISTFKGLGTYSSIQGKGPPHWEFRENKAIISSDERIAQRLVNAFNSYAKSTTDIYKDLLEKQLREKRALAQRQLRQRLEEEERRKRILGDIEF